ncbi:hypothetical protein [Spongiactinospora sp. TRM90649]|uniref:hypothetical protein n=1 Tax=Spongiactinospora sp. TRM90649 TaxID=3031114 RepID=UPI0023F989BF|nr:hypothetical protein [Spongiactinospora sp. TRM90649]MDF5756589.1 hypothetical protein [Spongiactinospora sp. TRM90649]
MRLLPRASSVDPEKVYFRQEVAEMFGVDRATVAEWSQKGYLNESTTPGGLPRVQGSSIIALVRRCTGQADVPGVAK